MSNYPKELQSVEKRVESFKVERDQQNVFLKTSQRNVKGLAKTNVEFCTPDKQCIAKKDKLPPNLTSVQLNPHLVPSANILKEFSSSQTLKFTSFFNYDQTLSSNRDLKHLYKKENHNSARAFLATKPQPKPPQSKNNDILRAMVENERILDKVMRITRD